MYIYCELSCIKPVCWLIHRSLCLRGCKFGVGFGIIFPWNHPVFVSHDVISLSLWERLNNISTFGWLSPGREGLLVSTDSDPRDTCSLTQQRRPLEPGDSVFGVAAQELHQRCGNVDFCSLHLLQAAPTILWLIFLRS